MGLFPDSGVDQTSYLDAAFTQTGLAIDAQFDVYRLEGDITIAATIRDLTATSVSGASITLSSGSIISIPAGESRVITQPSLTEDVYLKSEADAAFDITNGQVYTDPQKDAAIKSIFGSDSDIDAAFLGRPQTVSASGAYTWHTNPLVIEWDERLIVGSISADRTKQVQVTELSGGVVINEDVRTSASDDDHNPCSINVDPRTGALLVANTDHGTTNEMHLYSSTGALGDLTLLATITTTLSTYTQIIRHGADLDDIDIWGRSNEGDGFIRWHLYSTSNDFTAHTKSVVFRRSYFYTCPSLDGLNTHCVLFDWPGPANQVPLVSHMLYRHSDDALLGSGLVQEADIKASVSNTNGLIGRNRSLLANHNSQPGNWSGSGMNSGGVDTTAYNGDTVDGLKLWLFSNTSRYLDMDTLTNGEQYHLRFWVKGNEVHTIGLRIPGQVYSSGETNTIDVTTDWQLLSYDLSTSDDLEANNRLLFSALTADGYNSATFKVAFDMIEICKGLAADNIHTGARKQGSDGGVTAPAAVMASAEGGLWRLRFLDAWQFVDNYLDFVVARFDGSAGCSESALDNQSDCHYFKGRLNLTSYLVEDYAPIAITGDGLDSDTKTYVGGAAMLTPHKVIVGQNNLAGDGKGRLVLCESPGANGAWSQIILEKSDDPIQRPKAIEAPQYFDGVLTHARKSNQVVYMDGPYTDFDGANFETVIKTRTIT